MKKSFCLVAAAALLAACNSGKPEYKISGTVGNPSLDGQYVYLYQYGIPNGAPLDSAVVRNGKFVMEGVQNNPELCVITFSEDVISQRDKNKYAANRMMGPGDNDIFTAVLVLDNSDIAVELDTFSVVSGTPENDSLQVLINDMEVYNMQASPVAAQMRNFNNLSDADKSKLQQWYDKYVRDRLERAKTYVEKNAHKLTGAYVFGQYASFWDNGFQDKVLSQADSTFRSVPGIDKIEKRAALMRKVAVGQKYADFSLTDQDGKTVSLSDYVGKGKYVLLDFWASWCGPCIKEMPSLVNLYNKYKNRNFEIVGVSLDENKEAWLKALIQFNMKWPQLSDLKGWNSTAAQMYGVTSIPYTVLINPEGIIVEKGLRGKQLEQKLEEVIGKR